MLFLSKSVLGTRREISCLGDMSSKSKAFSSPAVFTFRSHPLSALLALPVFCSYADVGRRDLVSPGIRDGRPKRLVHSASDGILDTILRDRRRGQEHQRNERTQTSRSSLASLRSSKSRMTSSKSFSHHPPPRTRTSRKRHPKR
jgi:hypothetical protein